MLAIEIQIIQAVTAYMPHHYLYGLYKYWTKDPSTVWGQAKHWHTALCCIPCSYDTTHKDLMH